MIPAIARSVVVFPAPFGPMRPRISLRIDREPQVADRHVLAVELLQALDEDHRPAIEAHRRFEVDFHEGILSEKHLTSTEYHSNDIKIKRIPQTILLPILMTELYLTHYSK